MNGTTETADIGIVGGGQLGLMLVQAAIPLGLRTVVLDPDPRCPAARVSPVISGELTDPRALSELVSRSAVTTFEIEHTDPEHLQTLEREGARFAPSPAVLALISDKLEQKAFFREGGVPVATPLPIDTDGPNTESTPVIQKTRFGGYDGRGVAQVMPGEQFPLRGETFVEEAIPIDREIAVLVAVAQDGQSTAWDPMEMVFDPRLNLVSHVVSPADLSPATTGSAQRIAADAAALLRPIGFCGVLAVELFLQPNGKLVLNEVAPRPHNSGHLTIEASRCSQFEQHLRCVAGFPLGSTERLATAAMVNLLGPDHLTGPYQMRGVAEALRLNDVHLHLYGKHLARAGRKMGHVTARGTDREAAIRSAHEAAAAIRFEPQNNEERVW